MSNLPVDRGSWGGDLLIQNATLEFVVLKDRKTLGLLYWTGQILHTNSM